MTVALTNAPDLAELNTLLLAACRADEHRQIAGYSEPVGVAMAAEPVSLAAR